MGKRKKWGQGRTYLRGRTWWIEFYHNGHKVRESSRSDVHADAKELLRKRLGEIGIGRFVGPAAEKVTVPDLLDLVATDYEQKERRSTTRLAHARRHLLNMLGSELALQVTLARLEDYVAFRRRDGAALASVQYELSVLRRGYTLAVHRQLLPFRPPFPTLRVHNARKGFFERDQFYRLCKRLPEPVRAVALFAYLTGWRVPSEVLPLT